jgi:hypothetical protein
MAGYFIQIRTARGWRKLRNAGPFLLRDSAENYASKHLLAGWWRVVEAA